MSRGVWVRFFLVVGLLVGCLALAVNVKPNLGLDLRGGAQFIFEAEGTEQTPASAENVDKTLEVLRGRVDALGVAESTLRQGENRILVELPGVQDAEPEAEELIGSTAQLTFHPVTGTAQPNEKPKKGNASFPTRATAVAVGPTVIRRGVSGASGRPPAEPRLVRDDRLQRRRRQHLDDITGKAACNAPSDPNRRIAIVLDDEVISSPQVDPTVPCDVGIRGGNTQITGNFTHDRAKDLAALIKGGALPVPRRDHRAAHSSARRWERGASTPSKAASSVSRSPACSSSSSTAWSACWPRSRWRRTPCCPTPCSSPSARR